ncbi:MAG: ATP-binding cassette domain-containing protein, partial [Eubacterium sp.]|nr:ATP-binding cassette domain-containing protein [Eubacterium sp.]
QLSGGEKVRLALCKMFYNRPNLLILDEPTNHMDMVGKEALEQMLREFSGTVLFVSHDRYFIKQIATGVLEFGKDEVRQYQGGYEAYLEEKRKREAGIIKDISRKDATVAVSKEKGQNPTLEDVFDKKTYYNPGKIKSRLLKQLEKYEKQLAESEERANELKLQLMDPALGTDYEKLMALQEKLEAEEHEQETLLERMMETETELEELE